MVSYESFYDDLHVKAVVKDRSSDASLAAETTETVAAAEATKTTTTFPSCNSSMQSESASEFGCGAVATIVSLSPLTGRTHQLRVHMAHI